MTRGEKPYQVRTSYQREVITRSEIIKGESVLFIYRGVAQMVERYVWDVDVACSNRVTPTSWD